MAGALNVDELYVISDLHLGGAPGFQIFGSTQELVWLIDQLRQRPRTRRVALAINGDVVDFLAEPGAVYFDPLGASAKLERILRQDGTFRPICPALSRFVRTKGRLLVINLGNHDLELALPWVCRHLIELIADGDEAARGRIQLITDGTGAAFDVGAKRVLCLHGNEVDSWNPTDHESIRRIGRDVMLGGAAKAWRPNAGTQLVIDVMNQIKRRYPFVDLLKPETEAVVPILLALEPGLAAKLPQAMPVVGRRVYDALRMATGFLGEEEEEEEADGTAPLAVPAMQRATRGIEKRSGAIARGLVQGADDNFRADLRPMDLVSAEEQGAQLGLAAALFKRFTGRPLEEVLREALEGLDDDRSFDRSHRDQTFRDLDELVGPGADFLVAGHTHLERALPRQAGRGYYLNTGTWARLIQIDDDLRRAPGRLMEVISAFKKGKIADLEAVPNLVRRDNPVATFVPAGGKVEAQLAHVVPKGSSFDLAPVAGFSMA